MSTAPWKDQENLSDLRIASCVEPRCATWLWSLVVFLGILTSLLIEDHSISRSRVASQSCMVFCLTPFFRPVAWQSGSEGMLYFTGTLPRKAATEKTLTSNTGYLPAKFLKALMDSGSATSAVCRCRWEAGMVGCSETWFWSKVESCGRRVYIYIMSD